jgi:hypothetical protein
MACAGARPAWSKKGFRRLQKVPVTAGHLLAQHAARFAVEEKRQAA